MPQQEDQHDSLTLTMPMPLAVLESQGTLKEDAKKASQPCHFDLNWFLEKEAWALFDVTGISSRPRRKEKVQGWTRPSS